MVRTPHPLSHCSVRPELRNTDLSPSRRRLLSRAQHLYFGQILNLHVRRGEPVFDPPPRTIHRKKNGTTNPPRPQAGVEEFALKREWVDFFASLDDIGDGVILVIEVAHGVPIIHEYEDFIAV